MAWKKLKACCEKAFYSRFGLLLLGKRHIKKARGKKTCPWLYRGTKVQVYYSRGNRYNIHAQTKNKAQNGVGFSLCIKNDRSMEYSICCNGRIRVAWIIRFVKLVMYVLKSLFPPDIRFLTIR